MSTSPIWRFDCPWVKRSKKLDFSESKILYLSKIHETPTNLSKVKNKMFQDLELENYCKWWQDLLNNNWYCIYMCNSVSFCLMILWLLLRVGQRDTMKVVPVVVVIIFDRFWVSPVHHEINCFPLQLVMSPPIYNVVLLLDFNVFIGLSLG